MTVYRVRGYAEWTRHFFQMLGIETNFEDRKVESTCDFQGGT